MRTNGQFKSQDGGEGGGGEAIGCQRNGAENINADSFLPLFSLTQLKDNPSCSAVILGHSINSQGPFYNIINW